MRVIKNGIQKSQITCDNCGSILEYDTNDEYIGKKAYDYVMSLKIHTWFVDCPVCKTRIKTREIGFEDI